MKIGGRGVAKTWASKSRAVNGSRTLQVASVLTILLSSFLTGCAGFVNGTKTAGQAAFQLSPTNRSFGTVGVGKQSTQTVVVTNTGSTAVSIAGVTLSNARFTLPGAVFPVSLATGQSATLTVAVKPTAAGTI